MGDEYVKKEEFNILKNDVDKIKEGMSENVKALHSIETKIDVITERLVNSTKIDDLKIDPLEKRVTKLENGISWLWRLCATIVITGAVGAVITFK